MRLLRDHPKLSTKNWFAVETRVRAEYAAVADINAMDGLEAYLPEETRKRQTRKGERIVQHPLLPGFMFVSCDPDAERPDGRPLILDVLRSKAVRSIVRSPGGGIHPIRPKMVRGTAWHFVDELRARENAGQFDYTRDREPLEEGSVVRVINGAFKDQIARVISAPAEGLAEILLAGASGIFAPPVTVAVGDLELAA